MWNKENAQSEDKFFLQILEASTPGEADILTGMVDGFREWANFVRRVWKEQLLFFRRNHEPDNTIGYSAWFKK